MKRQKLHWVSDRAKFSFLMALIIFPLYLLSHRCQGQKLDGEHVLLVESIVDSLNMDQKVIKDKTKEWLGKTFNNGETVITSETDGSIVGHYLNGHKIGMGASMEWKHTIITDFKDNKIRIRIWADTNPSGYTSAAYFYKKNGEIIYEKWLNSLVSDAQRLSNSLKESLIAKQEDW